jgi:isocitrate/isopropylmalate dehydrogenase
VEQALEVLKVVSNATPDLNLDISTHLFGGCAIDATGKPLPDDTLTACKAADAILMGKHRSFYVQMKPSSRITKVPLVALNGALDRSVLNKGY